MLTQNPIENALDALKKENAFKGNALIAAQIDAVKNLVKQLMHVNAVSQYVTLANWQQIQAQHEENKKRTWLLFYAFLRYLNWAHPALIARLAYDKECLRCRSSHFTAC